MFRQIDTDQDGYITTGELVDSARGYYFDDDPGSAVAWTLDV